MIRLLIDTDPGVDDAHALMLAFVHPQAIPTIIFNSIAVLAMTYLVNFPLRPAAAVPRTRR